MKGLGFRASTCISMRQKRHPTSRDLRMAAHPAPSEPHGHVQVQKSIETGPLGNSATVVRYHRPPPRLVHVRVQSYALNSHPKIISLASNSQANRPAAAGPRIHCRQGPGTPRPPGRKCGGRRCEALILAN